MIVILLEPCDRFYGKDRCWPITDQLKKAIEGGIVDILQIRCLRHSKCVLPHKKEIKNADTKHD